MANVYQSGPPNSGQGASGANVNRAGAPMNSALGRRRLKRGRFHRAKGRRVAGPSRPM